MHTAREQATTRLNHMVDHGLLTPADADEVFGIVSVLVAKLLRGQISEHCADYVVRQLGAEKCRAWKARNREWGSR